MRLYILLVLLLFLLPLSTTPQFSTCDIRGTTPTLPCNYCTLSPTITIGANSTLPPTPQTLSVGLYSTSLALGTFSPSTTVATGPTAGPIVIGADTPTTPASTQVVTIADYSATLRLGRFANSIIMGNSPTAPSIIIGASTPTPTPTTIQNINICPWCSTLSMGSGNTGGVTIATGPTAGPVTIGSPTGNPTQVVSVGVGTAVRISNTNTPGGVVVGNEIPSPSPTFVQDGVYSRYGRNVYLADGAQSLAVSYLSTAGPVTIGSPTSNPGQTVTVAESSGNLYLGRGSPTTKLTNVVVCQNTPSSSPVNQYCDIGQATTFIRMGESLIGSLSIATGTGSNNAAIYIGMAVPTGSPSGPPSQNQEVYLFEYSRNVRIAQKIPGQLQLGTDANSGVLIANGPTAGPITLGRTTPAGAPSNSGSNLVQLKGLYHYFYSGTCLGNPSSSTATLVCDVTYRTNGAIGSGITSGYNWDDDYYYPPDVGHYMVTANALVETSSYGYLYIVASVGGSTATYAAARAYGNTDFLSISASTIISFDNVGSGNYIYLQGADLDGSGGSASWTRFVVTRVA